MSFCSDPVLALLTTVVQRERSVGAFAMAQQTASDAVVQQYRNCILLEQKLREESKQKNFYEPDVRAVRMSLRLAYEGLLFSDYAGAQVQNASDSRPY